MDFLIDLFRFILRLITWPFRMIWKFAKRIVSTIGRFLSGLWKLFEIYRHNMRWSVQFIGVGCIILLIGLTMLLFVLSPFYVVPLLGSDLVLKSRTTYTLSSESFRALDEKVKEKKFPRAVWTNLQDLQNTSITGEKNFLAAVRERIGKGYAKAYETLILENALPSYTLTKPVLDRLREILPENVVSSLEPLENRQFIGEDNFLDTVRNRIGEDVVHEHQTFFLEHAYNQNPRPRYILNSRSLGILRRTSIPNELVHMLSPLEGKIFFDQEDFLRNVRTQLGEGIIEKYQEIFLRYARSGVFKLNSKAIDTLREEGFDDGTLKKLESLLNIPIEGKEEFLAKAAESSGRTLNEKEKELLLAHSELPPFLDERSFEQFRCEGLPDYILSVLENSGLKGRNLPDESVLLKEIGKALGDGLTAQYENTILDYAHYSDSVLKSRELKNESFQLGSEFFEALEQEHIPRDVQRSVGKLRNREILGTQRFLTTLKERIGNDLLQPYEARILQHSLTANFTLSQESLKELGHIAERIRPLQDITIISKSNFLTAISQFIGEDDKDKYRQYILQHTVISLTVDEAILKYLRTEQQLPEELLERLETLKPLTIVGEDAFIKMVQDCTGKKDLVETYRVALLNESSFTLTGASLYALEMNDSLREIPREDLRLLESLQDRDISGQETTFLTKVEATLGDKYTERHKTLILEEVEKTYPVLHFDPAAAFMLMGKTLAGTEGLFIISCLALFVGLALLAGLSVTLTSFTIWLGEFIDALTSSRLVLVMMFVVTMSVLLVLAFLTGYITL